MPDTTQPDDLSALLESARRRLVETGTRNRLVHVNRANKRANALNIVDERSADIFDLMRVQGKRMRFAARDEEDEPETEPQLLALATDEDTEAAEARFRDDFLETDLGAEALQRRLLRLFADARTAEEEQGVNILFLALGFLRWFESDSSETLRESPLILLPVELIRDERRATYNLKARDADIVTNMPLQERLREDFGLVLPEIEEDEAFDPQSYFEEIQTRIEGRARWEIDRDGMQLGFFSFSKLLMMRDLEPEHWPDGAFDDHPILSGLLAGGFPQASPLFAPQEKLDPVLDPDQLLHVVPADASQTRVIEEVRAGRNLVVQGPPGTGKSQTIANIIAGAAHDGKRVLFVAEKMAALSVVHDRLQKVGLGDLCLEVHSRAANKKAFLQELARTLAAGSEPPDQPGPPDRLRAARDRLNAVATLLHDPVPGHGFTPFRALAEIARFVGRDVPPPKQPRDGLAALDDAARAALADRVAAYAGLLAQAGPRQDHPFAGVKATDLQPTDLQRLAGDLADAFAALGDLRARASARAEAAGQPLPATLADCAALRALLAEAANRPQQGQDATAVLLPLAGQQRLAEALSAGVDWAKARDEAGARFGDPAFEAEPAALRARLAPGASSVWARIFGGYRGASRDLGTLLTGSLPKEPHARLALVDELIVVRKRRAVMADEEPWLREALGSEWRGERTPFAALAEMAGWLDRLRAHAPLTDTEAVDRVCAAAADRAPLENALDRAEAALATVLARLDLSLPEDRLDAILTRLEAMHAQIDRYGEWAQIAHLSQRLDTDGLGPLLYALDAGHVAPDGAVDEVLYAIAEARWDAARAALPDLDDLRLLDRHALVAAFQDLEAARMAETRQLVHAKHLAQLPTGGQGQMGFLRGEMGKKRRHKPIRKIMQAAGEMVQRIKPVFLMSPISIAQYLPPGSVHFDLLVIDEASQVRPEDALGAIARAQQIVVVGDQKQLPPTSFFDRLSGGDDDEAEDDDTVATAGATEMESVLTLCEARGLNPAMLEWHYRSRDPSLIAVNNAEFYDHRLILPPSPVQNDPEYGLSFRRVPGVYSSRSRGDGRPGTNRIEAEALADAVAAHARTRPDLSLGVVAFSKAQADMLTEVLEVARRKDEILDGFLREGQAEDVFVKNIENVQGDERDVILISVGYGPAEPGGRLTSMSFGPINGEGGERRLNVLFSRARTRCVVFCSFDPNDIDTARTTREGPRVLKRFLEFARSGEMAQPVVTGEGFDSPLEEDVADVIAGLGYPCDAQVGAAGFRIDLGVRHPEQSGRYILAVECDGATYHAALWARERDRLRQAVLEGLGWRFHRIWSTDWFHRRASEIDRLRAALSDAALDSGPAFSGANRDGRRAPVEAPGESAEPVLPPPPELSAPAYEAAQITVDMAVEPHDAPAPLLTDLVTRIVAAEGPIHREIVARRVAEAFGKARTGRRIREVTEQALDRAAKSGADVQRDGAFAMTRGQVADPPVRDRSAEGAPVTKADCLPPTEIRAAAERVRSESGDMDDEALVTATARLLGFARTGRDLRAWIASVLSLHV